MKEERREAGGRMRIRSTAVNRDFVPSPAAPSSIIGEGWRCLVEDEAEEELERRVSG